MIFRLRTKWLSVRIPLLSTTLQIWRLLRAKSSLTFRQTIQCGFTPKLVRDMIVTCSFYFTHLIRFWAVIFSVWQFFLVYVFFHYRGYSRIVIKHYETSINNFNFKNRRIFLMCLMGNNVQTVYYFCKLLHLRSYRVPRTSFSSSSQ